MKNFIEAFEVKSNLDEYVIIDCRFDLVETDYGIKVYKNLHIKNAFFFDLEGDMSAKKSVHGGRHPLPDMAMFINKLEAIGISNDTKILVYDDDISVAARLWWMLKYIGITNVKILNGGINAAVQAGIEMESGEPNKSNHLKGKIDARINNDLLIEMDELKTIISKGKNYILIDSRSPERYKGLIEPYDKIPGRIPTSINIFFKDVMNENRIKEIEDLKKVYNNIDSDKMVIAYCGSGVTAPINIVAMDEVGLYSRLYLGSYSDYVSYKDNVIEKD